MRKLLGVVLIIAALAGCASLDLTETEGEYWYRGAPLYSTDTTDSESLEGTTVWTNLLLARLREGGLRNLYVMLLRTEAPEGDVWYEFTFQYEGSDWLSFDEFEVRTDAGIQTFHVDDPYRQVVSDEQVTETLLVAVTPEMIRALNNTTTLAFAAWTKILEVSPEGIAAAVAFLDEK